MFDQDLCKVVAPLTGTDSAAYLTAQPVGSTTSARASTSTCRRAITTTGAKSPLLIALNGYGENGDGSPGALNLLLRTGIPRFIDIGGWPTDRPLVVLALQHVEEPPGFAFERPVAVPAT